MDALAYDPEDLEELLYFSGSDSDEHSPEPPPASSTILPPLHFVDMPSRSPYLSASKVSQLSKLGVLNSPFGKYPKQRPSPKMKSPSPLTRFVPEIILPTNMTSPSKLMTFKTNDIIKHGELKLYMCRYTTIQPLFCIPFHETTTLQACRILIDDLLMVDAIEYVFVAPTALQTALNIQEKVIVLQCWWRTMLSYRALQEKKQAHVAAIRIQSVMRQRSLQLKQLRVRRNSIRYAELERRREMVRKSQENFERERALAQLRKLHAKERKERKELNKLALATRRERAAVAVQTTYRRYRAGKMVLVLRRERKAAIKIQAHLRKNTALTRRCSDSNPSNELLRCFRYSEPTLIYYLAKRVKLGTGFRGQEMQLEVVFADGLARQCSVDAGMLARLGYRKLHQMDMDTVSILSRQLLSGLVIVDHIVQLNL
ncbi:hypothetical protein B5M09_004049 [Aphanomyces astaci]|uniref:Uncharacterized protein n=1 Tax=Aphanomyces astaci TaxID=112090 RepID=A0A425D2T2_APHAT|nr:hypothetical protein B5M09_004049 [Aphanomyces astaci]